MGSVHFLLNGRPVTAHDDPHKPVLHVLRERGLTGTKEGCAEGECGACAVALVRPGPDGRARYEAVNSCLLLLGAISDQEVWTAEGIGSVDRLHPVQAAMVDRGGSQCGYCTPGFVVSLFAEYYRSGRDGYDPEAIAGNLCRCTGYRPIRDAARSLGRPEADDPFAARLTRTAPPLPSRILSGGPHGRRYHRPESLAEVHAILGSAPHAKLIAGGTDVVVDMNLRGDRYEELVALDGVRELTTIVEDDSCLEIGAAVPLRTVEERVAAHPGLLHELFPLFSSRLIRSRATLGGNVMTASPIGDGPPVLLALDAKARIAASGGERTVPLAELFSGYRRTVVGPSEVLVSVILPKPAPTIARFYKVSKRVQDDISTVAAAFALHLEGDGRVARARLAFGGVAPTPMRAVAAERALEGRSWDEEALAAAKSALAGTFQPIDDHRGSAAYRAAVLPRLLDKWFAETGDKNEVPG